MIDQEKINGKVVENIEVDLLLEGVYQKYGFDFRNYAKSSVRRRLLLRAKYEDATTLSELQGILLRDPVVMRKLLNDLSINVTEMFRDPSFFAAFRAKVVPKLRHLDSIRIWHAGCSTGEEVYSMAILLKEEGLLHKTQIYATDMNEQVLEKAAAGKIELKFMQSYTKNYQQSGGKKRVFRVLYGDSKLCDLFSCSEGKDRICSP